MAFDYAGAKAAGYSDQEIAAYLNAKKPTASPAQPTPQPTRAVQAQPVTTAPPSPKKTVLDQIVDAVAGPAVRYGKLVTSIPQTAVIGATGGKVNLHDTPGIGGIFPSEEELGQMGSGDLKKAALEGGKRVAGAYTYVLPAGETMKGALALGAATGALRGVSDSPEGTIDGREVAKGAIAGGIAGGALKTVSNVVKGTKNLVSGTGKQIEKAGDNLRAGVGKVEVEPSIWGAAREKQINNTLNKLGVNGNAQQKYEKLQPVFEQLGRDIQQELTTNPKSVSSDQVKQVFLKKLAGTLRSKELNNKQAQAEISGYLSDLQDVINKTGSLDEMSSMDLFNLKKAANGDYQGVAKKLQNKIPLNNREKVIAVARDVFDSLVSSLHPSVKERTLMQSNLYDAAESLARSRKTVPTVRVLGTTVPTTVQQSAQDAVGRGMKNVGQGMKNSVEKLGEAPIGRQEGRAALLPAIESLLDQPEYQPNTVENSAANNINGEDIIRQLDHTDTIPQPSPTLPAIDELVQIENPTTGEKKQVKRSELGQYGISDQGAENPTKEQLDIKIREAVASGNSKAASQLMEYSNYLYGKKPGNENPTLKAKEDLARSGQRGLDEVKRQLGLVDQTGNALSGNDLGQGTVDGSVLFKDLLPGKLLSRTFDSAMYRAVDAILRARTGATATEDEVRRYMKKFGPNAGDSAEDVKFKIQQLEQDFADALHGGNQEEPTTP